MQITPKTSTGISGTVVELSLSEMIVLRSLAQELAQTDPSNKEGWNELRQRVAKGQKLASFVTKITEGITSLQEAETELFATQQQETNYHEEVRNSCN